MISIQNVITNNENWHGSVYYNWNILIGNLFDY